jgi:hypothetical protein
MFVEVLCVGKGGHVRGIRADGHPFSVGGIRPPQIIAAELTGDRLPILDLFSVSHGVLDLTRWMYPIIPFCDRICLGRYRWEEFN